MAMTNTEHALLGVVLDALESAEKKRLKLEVALGDGIPDLIPSYDLFDKALDALGYPPEETGTWYRDYLYDLRASVESGEKERAELLAVIARDIEETPWKEAVL